MKPATLYAGTHEGGVFKRTDGGNWEPFNTGLTSTDVGALAIDPTNPNILYAGTALGDRLYRSTDGGESWSAASTGLSGWSVWSVESLAIDAVTPTTLYAGTGEGGVFKSTNAGGEWRAFDAGLTASRVHASAIDPKRPMILYAGTDRGMFGINQVEMKNRVHLPLVSSAPTFTTCEDIGAIPGQNAMPSSRSTITPVGLAGHAMTAG